MRDYAIDEIKCHHIFAIDFADGKRVAVGYGDGSIKVFDLKSGDVVHSLTDASTSHSPSAVTALAAKDNLLASGGADGVAKVFNVQSGKNIATFVHGNRGSGRNAERSASTSAAGLLIKYKLDHASGLD